MAFNQIKIKNDCLSVTYLPIGAWLMVWTISLSYIHALFYNTQLHLGQFIVAGIAVILSQLYLPLCYVKIDKKSGIITLKYKRLYSKLEKVKALDELESAVFVNGVGSTGTPCLCLQFNDGKVKIIASDLWPGHKKMILEHQTIINKFIS